MWNATGSALLVLSYADFDATNQSYYGGARNISMRHCAAGD
jgi:hypothetical protein